MVYESERNGRLDAIGQIERPRNVLRRPVVVSFNSSRNLAWVFSVGWGGGGGGEWRVPSGGWWVGSYDESKRSPCAFFSNGPLKG